RRPHDDVLRGLPGERKLDVDRGVRLVAVFDLRLRERGLAARAPLEALLRLEEEALVERLPEGTPCGLDVLVRDRDVRMLRVHPDAKADELVVHLPQEVEAVVPARVHEALDPDLLDLLLV